MPALLPILALAGVAFLFVALSLPPYLTLDPSRSRVPVPEDVPGYYALLVGHVLCGSLALLTACLQLWPGLRERRPALHRRAGRIYVFGAVLPAAALALPIAATSPFGPAARASSLVLAVLWLGVTLTGYRMGRRGRFREHRRWMVRSFALTASVITNRVWAALAYVVLSPQLETTFAGNETFLAWTIAGLSTWLGWTLPLLAAEGWLERERLSAAESLPASPDRAAIGI